VPVGYAATTGLTATVAGSQQATGPGVVLGLPSGYGSAFPGEVRVLSGASQGVLVAQQTAAAHAGPGLEVWRHADSWRLNAPAARSFHFRTAGADRHLIVQPTDGGYELKLDARTRALQCLPLSATDARLTLDGSSFDATSLVRDGHCDVFVQGLHHQFDYLDPLAHVGEESVAEGHIRAIMPGRVVALLVQPGARVARGEPLLILEAMKMEHTIAASHDGVIAEIAAEGAQVTDGTVLVRFAEEAA